MPKTQPNTNLPKKMPKSPKPQEKQAVLDGIKSSKKVTLDELYIRARGKTYDEFLRDISKDDLFREQYIDAFSKSVDEKILKVKEMLSESGLPQGTIDAVIRDLKEIDTKVL